MAFSKLFESHKLTRILNFVFEPWMSTTDSLQNQTETPFFNFPFKHSFSVKFATFLLFLLSCLGYSLYGQNQIDLDLSTTSQNHAKGKITLTKNSTGEKTAVRTDSVTGKLIYKPNIPSGEYKVDIEVPNTYLWSKNNLLINTNLDLKKIMIDSTETTSTIYNNSLEELKKLTWTVDGAPNTKLNAWASYKNIRLFANNSTMPEGWRAGFDRVINDVITKSEGEITFREEQTDSLGGIRFFFVPTNQFPVGAGSRGYTLRSVNEFGYYEARCYVATDLNDITQYESVIMREMARALGLESFSSDNKFVMYTYWVSGNKVFHHDEGKVLHKIAKIVAKIPVQTGIDLFDYKKTTVVKTINWPAEKTSNIGDIIINEDSQNNIIAKVSNHFIDPENGPLTYSWINNPQLLVTLQEDTLKVTPITGFYGNTQLVLKATDNQGQTAEPNIINILVNHVNHPPSMSNIINPSNNDTIKTANYTFKWTKSHDPDMYQSVGYIAQFSGPKDTTINNLVDTLLLFNDVRGKLGEGKDYALRIIATDGIDSTISAPVNFNTGLNPVNQPPTNPVAITPQNNAILNDKNEIFGGTKSIDPEGDPIRYEIHIFNAEKDTSITELVNPLLYFTNIYKLGFGKTYKWHIKATAGEHTVSSDTLVFKIKDFTQLQPQLILPVNNDTLENNQLFQWTRITGPYGEQISYSLHIFNSEKDTILYSYTDSLYQLTSIRQSFGLDKNYNWFVRGILYVSPNTYSYIYSDTNSFNTGGLTSIKDGWKNYKGFSLLNNYPNPFNGTTVISYTLAKEVNVRLSVFNILGEEIAVLVNGVQTENYYEVAFNTAEIPSGVYYYRIAAAASDGSEQFSSVKKMVVLK